MIEFYSVLFGCSWLIGKAKACRKQKAGVYLIHACFRYTCGYCSLPTNQSMDTPSTSLNATSSVSVTVSYTHLTLPTN